MKSTVFFEVIILMASCYSVDARSWLLWRSREVPSILNQALPAASADIERELEETRRFAWRYTALLENPSYADAERNTELLTQALYNVRQHEAFLKIILVSYTDVQSFISRTPHDDILVL